MSLQLSLPLSKGRGGRRDGAGRPRGRRTVAHRRRPEHRGRLPLHVTMRARGGLPSFRSESIAAVVRDAIRATSLEWFRVVHFSIQSNHVHLIVEANDKEALTRGMQSLNARIARAVNAALGVRGGVWRERYHARELATPREVRNALVYVLMNARKHGVQLAGIDPRSSGEWFDGFAGHVPKRESSPVCAARTWLASVGWRKHGLLRLDERPLA